MCAICRRNKMLQLTSPAVQRTHVGCVTPGTFMCALAPVGFTDAWKNVYIVASLLGMDHIRHRCLHF